MNELEKRGRRLQSQRRMGGFKEEWHTTEHDLEMHHHIAGNRSKGSSDTCYVSSIFVDLPS
jgi:hypothetical protein